MLLGVLAVAGPAQANSLAPKAAKADQKAKAMCAKAKKAKGKAKARANKNCSKAKSDARKAKARVDAGYFDVCNKPGCEYRSIQSAADAAGKFQKKTKEKATVRVKPGTYELSETFLDGMIPSKDFDGLTIMGVKANMSPALTRADAKKVILDGKGGKSDAIEARSVNDLKLMNMWAKNYTANTFFVWAAISPVERCEDYVMKNLISSDTRSYGLFARNCFGGKMIDSVGWNHGDSAFYVGETPCDRADWSSRSFDEGRAFLPRDDESGFLGHQGSVPPCQKKPNWTILQNIESFQNVLGYSGTNAKYVHIKDSVIYNNGAGLVPNTLDSERFEPGGWSKFTNNDIFWNNYNYYREDTEFNTVSNGLGEIAPGIPVNYPTGIGVMLFGNDGIEVSGNRIFGHEKWGTASFSSPNLAGVAVTNSGDDAKNLNNSFINNVMSGNGDPNAVDFFDDASGGGNCYSGNSAVEGSLTFARGFKGTANLAAVYPACVPGREPVLSDGLAPSGSPFIGLQLELEEMANERPGSPDTILGYAGSNPAETQECSWSRIRPYDPENPATFISGLTGDTYTEKRPSNPEFDPACN